MGLLEFSYIIINNTNPAPSIVSHRVLSYNNQIFGISQSPYIKQGGPIRLVKTTTTLTHGQTGTYTGNDGKVYRTICIGTQEWLADNLCETKFRNGDWITGFDGGVYTPISNADWATEETHITIALNHYGSISTFASGYITNPTQSFVVSEHCFIRQIRAEMSRQGSPDFQIRMGIYTETDDLPVTLIALSTNTVDASDLSTERIFEFNTQLPAGKYCIYLTYESVVLHNETNFINVRISHTTEYPDGVFLLSI